MPLSVPHTPFVRKLSVQPEEENAENEIDYDAPPLSECGMMPLSFPHSPPTSTAIMIPGPCDIDGEMGENYLRKLSIASMSSIKSTTSSVSSSYSAPPGISVSLGSGPENSYVICEKEESFDMKPMSRRMMTSRPSFISLCSIVSETSEVPQKFLPAPLQVELDLMQRSGIEGDEPKCRSHLPILRCPSDYDINEIDMKAEGSKHTFFRLGSKKGGLVNGIKHFPNRIRKMSTEKNRFDVYSISDDTREQLKRLYVY